MAHLFDTNTIPATGSVCLYKLLAKLIAQGWTKPKDSDGTTYSAVGAQILSGAAGGNGLGNTSAWFVVHDPNGLRSFCFQRGISNLVWRAKYSKAAGFTGGAPSNTQVPSAADEALLLGGGTDAAPTYATLFGADGTLRFNCCAADASVGYGFYFDAFTAGNANSAHYSMMLDIMAAGSGPPTDPDPSVIYMANAGAGGATAWGADLYGGTTSTRSYLGASFLNLLGMALQTTAGIRAFPGDAAGHGVGTNPTTAQDDGVPIFYARPATAFVAPSGYKGCSSLLRWSGTLRSNMATISNTGVLSRDKIWINGCLLPWDGSAASI